MTQFSNVSSTYGAPMGRHEYGIAENCEPGSISVFKVNLDSGGYDDGGAYWGIPSNLYCAQDDDDRYIHFVRANSPSEAISKLGIDPEYLAEQGRVSAEANMQTKSLTSQEPPIRLEAHSL